MIPRCASASRKAPMTVSFGIPVTRGSNALYAQASAAPTRGECASPCGHRFDGGAGGVDGGAGGVDGAAGGGEGVRMGARGVRMGGEEGAERYAGTVERFAGSADRYAGTVDR